MLGKSTALKKAYAAIDRKCLKIQNESTVSDNNILNLEAALRLGASSVNVTEN